MSVLMVPLMFFTAKAVKNGEFKQEIFSVSTKKVYFAAMAVIYDLHKVVLFHRKRAGLSRTALAELAGVGKTVIYDIEKGKSTVKWATILAVLHSLNVSIQFESPLMNEYEKSLDQTS